jgi:hypothetical protein
LAAGKFSSTKRSGASEAEVSAIRNQAIRVLGDLPPNPLRLSSQEADIGNTSEDEMALSGVDGNE